MKQDLRHQAERIVAGAIGAVLPDAAVERALAAQEFSGRVVLVAAGKAAWQMAKTARDCLGDRILRGIVLTKYGHVKAPLGDLVCLEAGHPVPDANTFAGTQQALELVSGLTEADTVLFLLSGGGSALFEKPRIDPEELQEITRQLLACGADITQINTIRKRLSMVKGGRFARACAPAKVFSVVLSDVLGDRLDVIASGPAYPDSSTCAQAMEIVARYGLRISPAARACLAEETPKTLDNVQTCITGSVRELCRAAAAECEALGYETTVLTDQLSCEARQAGSDLAAVARKHIGSGKKLAFVAGGETVVKLTGTGLGGRNQELALSAAKGIDGLKGVCVFSVGSDGTDGPTDAAGGYADGNTAPRLRELGIEIDGVLARNDSYHALERVNGLIITGPTGTNVNDVAVVLIDP